MSSFLKLPDGTVFPDPNKAKGLEWALRHTPLNLSKEGRMVLASVVSAYCALITMTQKERDKKVSMIRKAMEGE